ncbi:protein prenyltransferase alpha subunit repeat-containing protein 1-like isoform X1 [Hibiscus syriacus]|uniref:protein prenyltransferase alpha subunit repeat-containing protein 1-like isoform X1 n=1 Tax=Hibiscus syriacus TaxID=106335 RepID=UPI001920C3CF|nr:protein prenyltransferase alpha subunit repeat-containing protein 1-like isoform X1 [Hibiscus syriacus]
MDLLSQLETILESDPLIDEVGLIHSSQFVTLNKEVGEFGNSSVDDAFRPTDTKFWNRDHKLGISTEVVLPLCKAAKSAFMDAMKQYKMLSNLSDDKHEDENIVYGSSSSCQYFEHEVMKHSRALLLLSCDFGTAWNARKLLVLKKPQLSVFTDELLLSALVLSYSPKSEQAWSHRRWVIKMIAEKYLNLQQIVAKESGLVEKIAERSKMNYRAWNHRCWLVSYMTREQMLHELKRSKDWAGLHVADNSCFHYRRRLILRILENKPNKQGDNFSYDVENYQVMKEELELNEVLIKRYIGREALWLHRRYLSLCWIRHLTTMCGISYHSEQKTNMDNEINIFFDKEFCLLDSCLMIQDTEFEDFEAQAMCSAIYFVWLIKKIPQFRKVEMHEKLKVGNLKNILHKTCSERSFLRDLLEER